MLLKLLWFFSIVCAIHAQYEQCTSYKDCLENKGESKITARLNKNKLDKKLQEVTHKFIEDYKKEIYKLNEKISKSASECHSFKLWDYAPNYAVHAIEWCRSNALHCKKDKESRDKNQHGRDHNEKDDNEDKYCSEFTKTVNDKCDEITFKIYALEKCNEMKLFNRLYVEPWQNCVEQFNKHHKSKYYKCKHHRDDDDEDCDEENHHNDDGDRNRKHKKDRNRSDTDDDNDYRRKHRRDRYDDDDDDYNRKHRRDRDDDDDDDYNRKHRRDRDDDDDDDYNRKHRRDKDDDDDDYDRKHKRNRDDDDNESKRGKDRDDDDIVDLDLSLFDLFGDRTSDKNKPVIEPEHNAGERF